MDGKIWRLLIKVTECTKSAAILDRELSELFIRVQGVPGICTLSLALIQIFVNDMLKVEALRQGVKIGESEVSGLFIRDDFVGDV